MRRIERTVPEIAADSAFGIACGVSEIPSENLAELFQPEHFSAIELPAVLLETESAPELIAKALDSFEDVQVGTIASLPEEDLPDPLLREFAERTGRLLAGLAEAGIHTAALDFSEKTPEETLLRAFRPLAPALNRTGVTLLLPFALPCDDPEAPMHCIQLLRRSMIPQLKVRLDLHLAALPPVAPRDLAGTLLQEVRSVFLRWNADAGEFPRKEQLAPWLAALERNSFRGSWLAAPRSTDPFRIRTEALRFAELLHELKQPSAQ